MQFAVAFYIAVPCHVLAAVFAIGFLSLWFWHEHDHDHDSSGSNETNETNETSDGLFGASEDYSGLRSASASDVARTRSASASTSRDLVIMDNNKQKQEQEQTTQTTQTKRTKVPEQTENPECKGITAVASSAASRPSSTNAVVHAALAVAPLRVLVGLRNKMSPAQKAQQAARLRARQTRMQLQQKQRSPPIPSTPRLASYFCPDRSNAMTSSSGSTTTTSTTTTTTTTETKNPSTGTSATTTSASAQMPWFSADRGINNMFAVGINYTGQDGQLRGCIADQERCIAQLTGQFGYNNVVGMTEFSEPADRYQPVRSNLERAYKDICSVLIKQEQQWGSARFVYSHSSHGTWERQVNNGGSTTSELTGKDELIVPLDYNNEGCIRDDQLFAWMVKPLIGKNVTFTGLMDLCHSGSIFDLPNNLEVDLQEGRGKTLRKVVNATTRDLVRLNMKIFSACHDDQTAADATSSDGKKSFGAFTKNFWDVLDAAPRIPGTAKPKITYCDLMCEVQRRLIQQGMTQRIQLSSYQPIRPEDLFDM